MKISKGLCGIAVLGGLAACAASPTNFPAGTQLDYQLGGAYEPADGVGIVVRDSTAEPVSGVYSICYVNAFQTQPGESALWREEGLVLEVNEEPIADPEWPDEYLLDTSTEDRRAGIARRIGEVLQRCSDKGFSAVELDNLDSYVRSGNQLELADNLALAEILIDRGHELGLMVGQKNAAEESSGAQKAGFDFAVAEQCIEFDECNLYADAYGSRVLDIEYPDASNALKQCSAVNRPASTVLRDRELTTPGDPAYLFHPCP